MRAHFRHIAVYFAKGLGKSERSCLAARTGIFGRTLLLVAGAAAVRLVAGAGARTDVEFAVDAGRVGAGAKTGSAFGAGTTGTSRSVLESSLGEVGEGRRIGEQNGGVRWKSEAEEQNGRAK